jgi:tetratricopeptide (TPR) repeat protein/cold shock CspA family protein
LRESGNLKEVLSRYGAIDQRGDPAWNDLELVLEIGKAYSLVGNDAKVESYFLRCAEINPRRAALYHCQIGWFFQRKKKWARALAWYERALETFPTYHICLFRKGYCLERLHRPRAAAGALAAAEASFEAASPAQQERSRGIQVQVLFHLGRNLREIGDTAGARRALDRSAALDEKPHERVIKPEHRLASYGETYLREGDSSQAIRCLEEARDLDPRSAVIHERLGLAYQQAGRTADAEAALRRAIELPKGAVALITLGRLYAAIGRLREAAETLLQASEQHPQGEVQIRIEIADLHLRLGRPRAALEELEHLAHGRVPPQSTLSVSVQTRIARILLEHGEVARAIEQLHAAIESDPAEPALQRMLSEAIALRDAPAADVPPPRELVDQPLPDEVAFLGRAPLPRLAGVVNNFFPGKGYGFITYGADNRSVFFHVSHCETADMKNLQAGSSVSFVLGSNLRKGKPQAEQVRIEGEPSSREQAALVAPPDSDLR